MGLRDEISQDIKLAFDTDLADAVQRFDGTRRIANSDDWAINGNQGTKLQYQGRGVFGNYSANEIDGTNITKHDVKLTCLQAETTAVPMIDDVINGYVVLSVAKDPADVSYSIQLRAV